MSQSDIKRAFCRKAYSLLGADPRTIIDEIERSPRLATAMLWVASINFADVGWNAFHIWFWEAIAPLRFASPRAIGLADCDSTSFARLIRAADAYARANVHQHRDFEIECAPTEEDLRIIREIEHN